MALPSLERRPSWIWSLCDALDPFWARVPLGWHCVQALCVYSKAQLWVTSEVEERVVPRGGKGGSRISIFGSDCPDGPCVLPWACHQGLRDKSDGKQPGWARMSPGPLGKNKGTDISSQKEGRWWPACKHYRSSLENEWIQEGMSDLDLLWCGREMWATSSHLRI